MVNPAKHVAVFSATVALVGCGSSSSSAPVDGGGTSGNRDTDSSGGGEDGGVIFTANDAGSFGDGGNHLNGFVGCATDTQQAKALPLDLYFMMDTSGSMNALVSPQQSKWKAVQTAMAAFVNDPASSGIGVGLQYFPLVASGVPATCTASAQCGAAGPCLLKACDLTMANQVVPCDTNADCAAAGFAGLSCLPIGECQNDHNTVCPVGITSCGRDPNNFDLGACQTMSMSSCVGGDSCTTQDYATPAVAIAPLPGVASQVIASLGAHQPNGNTPTSAALQGAIDEAKAYAGANPGHTVVAVLATDGVPTECTPTTIPQIAQIAAAGASGNPRVKTFAIGVFTPGDIGSGTAAVNQIASAGGTAPAFVIDTTTPNVEQQFITALNAIRGASLPCRYELPVPKVGMTDFGRLNVRYTSGGGGVSTLPYVETPARCDPSTGGWYYDADPAEGGVPKAILVCPSTCTKLESDSTGHVDVIVGCQTLIK